MIKLEKNFVIKNKLNINLIKKNMLYKCVEKNFVKQLHNLTQVLAFLQSRVLFLIYNLHISPSN